MVCCIGHPFLCSYRVSYHSLLLTVKWSKVIDAWCSLYVYTYIRRYIIQHKPLPNPYPHHPATLFFKPTISFHLCLTSPNPIHPPNVPLPPSLSSFSHGLSKNQICHNTNNRDKHTLVTVHHQLHTPSWSHAYLLWTLKQQLPILNIMVYKHTQHQSTHARPLKELELEMRHT